MKLKDIIKVLEEAAPLDLACEWDNVGLLYGNPEQEIKSLVLCLDVTPEVLELCQETGANLCISHHPFIFDPIRRFDSSDRHTALVAAFIKSDIALYAAHTNLDFAPGGVNDSLAQVCGLGPAKERVSEELFIYNYQAGGGIRFFDLYRQVCEALKVPALMTNMDEDKTLKTVCVSGGSFDSDWTDAVIASGADALLTGEVKHHDLIRFAMYEIPVLAAGHAPSERVVLKPLAERIKSKTEGLSIALYEGLDYNKIGS